MHDRMCVFNHTLRVCCFAWANINQWKLVCEYPFYLTGNDGDSDTSKGFVVVQCVENWICHTSSHTQIHAHTHTQTHPTIIRLLMDFIHPCPANTNSKQEPSSSSSSGKTIHHRERVFLSTLPIWCDRYILYLNWWHELRWYVFEKLMITFDYFAVWVSHSPTSHTHTHKGLKGLYICEFI